MTAVQGPAAPERCRNLIGGEWRDPADAPRRDVISPWTGRPVASVPLSGPREVADAVAAAKRAAASWRTTPTKERAQALLRYRELLLADLDAISMRAALESGKTFDEARAGVLKGIEVLEFALSLQNLDDGAALEVSRGVSCEVRREPLGVVAGITPFNFPAMVPMWLFPIAIAVGNAFVLKPSEKVPSASSVYGELARQAFPPGVFSIVHGAREATEALVDHPDVAAIGFVGSSPVAKSLYTRATALGKRALCLGGAKNTVIVVPDADPRVTVPGVLASFTGCAGQRCMAASLLEAVGEVDAILAQVTDAARALRLGEQMGAIIDRGALERLEADIERAVADGAELRLDGRRPTPPAGYEGGNWLAPTILDRARPGMECVRKELFGPVLTIVRVATLEDALAIEAASPYGNATSVFTTRGAVARRVAERATSGMIGVNVGVPVPREPFSFGGTKESRFGAGDVTGKAGVEHWSTLKKITTKWELAEDSTWMS